MFNISYGNGFALSSLKKDKIGINFISRTSKHNGVSSIVKEIKNTPPYKDGLITVAVSGSVLESFVQTKPFYTGYHVMILEPKKEINLKEKLFYCLCIKRNKYKYSYGRQANRTLKDIELPDKVPKWVYNFDTSKYDNIEKSFTNSKLNLKDRTWKIFTYSEVFDIERGYYNKRPDIVGNINFISASMFNNGITDKVDSQVVEKMYEGNCITVINNGHAGEAFYQEFDFTCSHDVNIIRLKNKKLNVYISMFLIPLFRKEKYRFNYGRKWRYERMEKSVIKLPVTKNGKPDWEFMEQYIKSLKYSKVLN